MRSSGPWRVPALLAGLSMSLLVAGCGTSGSSGSSGGGGGGDATTVDVTLQEWAVVLGDDSAPAGDVTFRITNNGPNDVHEFVVFKTDLDPGDLPTDDRGVVDEEGDGVEVVDEVEDVAVGSTEELTVSLDSGSYVLVCNIYDEDEGEAHYAMGMRSAFTVP